MMEQFITSEVQNVMTTDALESSHPISIKVHHPDEINEIFDRISYEKGMQSMADCQIVILIFLWSGTTVTYLRCVWAV